MKRVIAIIAFLLVLTGHFLYTIPTETSTDSDNNQWAAYTFDRPPESRFSRYIGAGEYWLGLSYALAGAFAAFCLARAINRRRNFAAASGGVALSGILWVGVCFFTGCCGSPILPIYLGLLGPKFIGVTKPLTFGLTVLSISIGAGLIFKRSRDESVKLIQIQTEVAAGQER